MASSKQDSTAKGVSDAFDFWLSQHDISVPTLMEDAIKKAVRDWLDENSEEIIAEIAKAVADIVAVELAEDDGETEGLAAYARESNALKQPELMVGLEEARP